MTNNASRQIRMDTCRVSMQSDACARNPALCIAPHIRTVHTIEIYTILTEAIGQSNMIQTWMADDATRDLATRNANATKDAGAVFGA